MPKSPDPKDSAQLRGERKVVILVFPLGLSLFAGALVSEWLGKPVLLRGWFVGTLITTPILAGLLMRRTDFTMALFVATAFVLGGLTAVWVITLGLDVDPSSSVEAFTAILWTAAAPFAVLAFALVILVISSGEARQFDRRQTRYTPLVTGNHAGASAG